MSTLEIKQELHKLIDKGDDQFVLKFYEVAKSYFSQKRKDNMIAEGEDDIKTGNTYSLNEAFKIIDNWDD